MDQGKRRFKLVDNHGRFIHKLRIQLTDNCNFRCFYCMPQNPQFLHYSKLLNASEIFNICSGLVDLGIDEIRVSGGEPTVRNDFEDIMIGLSRLPVFRFGITTNGFKLKDKLSFLKQTHCHYINVSFDSLKESRFNSITNSRSFKEVYTAILKAKELNFHVKVNVVIMRGINDDEVFDFVEFSAKNKIEVRFLELMKIGPNYRNHSRFFVPASEVIRMIGETDDLMPQPVNCDSTSFNCRTSSGARIGFIASESRPFYNFCSRLRLTATGTLRACLMSNSGINLKGLPKSAFPQVLKSVIAMKPIERINHIDQPMYQIGG